MLYKNKAKFDEKAFENPGACFRGAPFWSWNTQLDEQELLWQIDRLREMGFGGFFMHTRAGMQTEYLGKEFMSAVRACVKHAKDENMLAYLYDEDRWPSGAAGGYVTENPEFRSKFICLTREPADEVKVWAEKDKRVWRPLSRYEIQFAADGTVEYRILPEGEKAHGEIWYAYLMTDACTGWYNGYTYIDAMNPDAVDKFIETTHDAYKREVGGDFGDTVPAIFTDEPNFGWFYRKRFARDGARVMIPWTQTFADTFRARYGYDIFEQLPQLIWNRADGAPATARYHYIAHATERFAEAFSDRIGKWCDENGIAFTGHVLEEPTLLSQTRCVGEAMRQYRNFRLPGIDMLCNSVELTTAKQAQSAVHQYGREGMLSELYGVTGWEFDFRGHKFQGDWQAALGVTLRVPHLSWVSMKGSAKRDYPASISYQSSWYKEYTYIEDHFARLNTALTRGTPSVQVAVIHPIESYWITVCDKEHCADECDRLEKQFQDLTGWLLRGTVDFDFVSESLLPELYEPTADGFRVGKMTYKAVVVPPVKMLRSTTIAALEKFVEQGGTVLCTGACPTLVDGCLSAGAESLYKKAQTVEFSLSSVLRALQDVRDVEILNEDGSRTENLLYNLRCDGKDKWLFVAHCEQAPRKDGAELRPQHVRLTVQGKYRPVQYDTVHGTVQPVAYKTVGSTTVAEFDLYAYDSLLLRLEPADAGERTAEKQDKTVLQVDRFFDKVKYRLDEPNVMVLDICEYSWDGKTYFPPEEMLRLDGKLRKEFDYTDATGKDMQPWKIPPEKPDKFPYLRFRFDSEIAVPCKLAYEEATEVFLNGQSVAIRPDGYFVDKDIKTTSLPALRVGRNELIVRTPISKRISLENMFLLGDFGVRTEGCRATVTALPEKLAFGSITHQGLPFYGGAVTYELPVTCDGTETEVLADTYAGALLNVRLDGAECGKIVYPPYRLPLGALKAGQHTLELTVYASRVNCFGALHDNVDKRWKGPFMWYTQGGEWAYEYRLHDVGVLKSPEILHIK